MLTLNWIRMNCHFHPSFSAAEGFVQRKVAVICIDQSQRGFEQLSVILWAMYNSVLWPFSCGWVTDCGVDIDTLRN